MICRLTFGALALAAILTSGAARADDSPLKEQCFDAYTQGQRLQKKGDLLAARAQLLVCARDPCPGGLQPECAQWLEDVERRLPTLVVTLRGQGAAANDGSDSTTAKLFVDDVLVSDTLDGRSLTVNPGDHVIRLEPASHAPLEQRIVIAEGEKLRPVAFSLEPPSAPITPPLPRPPPIKRRPIPGAAYVAGGVGVVGLAVFGVAGVVGVSEYGDLKACRPRCDDSAVGTTRTTFLVADVSLALGIVALGVATYLVLTRPTHVDASAATNGMSGELRF